MLNVNVGVLGHVDCGKTSLGEWEAHAAAPGCCHAASAPVQQCSKHGHSPGFACDVSWHARTRVCTASSYNMRHPQAHTGARHVVLQSHCRCCARHNPTYAGRCVPPCMPHTPVAPAHACVRQPSASTVCAPQQRTAVSALSTTLSTAALDKHPQSKERGITLDLGFSAFTVSCCSWLQTGCNGRLCVAQTCSRRTTGPCAAHTHARARHHTCMTPNTTHL
jgi:hypothetical protein